MKRRALFLIAGLLAGAVVALAVRDGSIAKKEERHGSLLRVIRTDAAHNSGLPQVADMAELAALWESGGELEVYEALAGASADRLTAWLNALLPGKTGYGSAAYVREAGLRDVLVQRLAERDPLALATWLGKVPSGHRDSRWVSDAVRALLAEGTPEAAAALARLRKEYPLLDSRKLETLADHDPAAANISLTWGRYDLPAAKAWLEQLPSGTARDKAGEQLSGLVSASGE